MSGLSAASVPDWVANVGAKTPFITHEAEDPANSTNGTIVRLQLPPTREITPAHEACGRAYVELGTAGQHLNIPVTANANTLVVRFCIPDGPEGGGIDATLSLYVNGTFRQKLPLNSKHAWVYGPVGENGQSNSPSKGAPHVFWDEARAFVTGGLKAGDVLSLRKDAGDSAEYYRVDLVDLEQVAPPAAMPTKGFLSVTDFGANGSDDVDDTDALKACVEAAKAQGKSVWLPPGTYRQSDMVTINGPLEVRGAGPWYTIIQGTEAGNDWSGRIGFRLSGDGPRLRDFYIESLVHDSRRVKGGKPFIGRPANWSVSNVWITHTNVGLWVAGTGGTVRDCRVRATYADAININCGGSDTLIENNHVRGSGDDGIAILSELERNHPPSKNNTVRHNTIQATWWGHNIDLAGGSGHVIEDNLVSDNALMGTFTINLPPSYPMHPLSDSVVRRNLLVRGGGDYARQNRGAVWIFAGSTTINNVTIEDNIIRDSMFSGIQIAGSREQSILFKNNLVEGPRTDGIVIASKAKGLGTFVGNKVSNLGKGFLSLRNKSEETYKVTLNNNTLEQ
jgi:hypothetical protein